MLSRKIHEFLRVTRNRIHRKEPGLERKEPNSPQEIQFKAESKKHSISMKLYLSTVGATEVTDA